MRKSHFQFTNNERNGIFLLIIVLVTLQIALWTLQNATTPIEVNASELEIYEREIDSLRAIKTAAQQPNVFPFNPNFITDFKGYSLGMTNEEIDRLHQFRSEGRWINSAKQFQVVTHISDSLLNAISPLFKFPDWVTNPKPKSSSAENFYSANSKPKTYDQKIDLNLATTSQLQKIYGVGEKLSQRILDYRNKFVGGFHHDIELTEVYGLTPEVIDRINKEFTVKTPRPISRINLNTATRDELVTIKYIDYEIANNIVEERTLRDGFKSFEELTKIEQFPVKKLEIIKLYLQL